MRLPRPKEKRLHEGLEADAMGVRLFMPEIIALLEEKCQCVLLPWNRPVTNPSVVSLVMQEKGVH
jgi:hypothetical protein